jgi:hypothetical protein
MKNFIKENGALVAIVFASIIIGGFFYASQISKQTSIERQQENELRAKKDSEDEIRMRKDKCVTEATEAAKSFYKNTCKYSCQPEFYYVDAYDQYYKKCLQKNGLL